MSTATTNHIGRKISRIRELRDMKQEVLATALGVSQQMISNIENSENVEEATLNKIAEALGVTADGIKHFSEEAIFNIIGNTVTNNDHGSLFNYNCTFNPIDKIVALFEEKEKLFERLLQAEKDKVVYLEKLVEKR